MAGESIGCRPGAAMQLEANVLTESIKNHKEQIVKVDKEIEKICGSCKEYTYLLTIPGFGPYVSAVVLAAIGNPHRFENIQQLKRLAGLDLNASRSGKRSSSAVPVISKKGKGDLRYALYQAALMASSLTVRFRGLLPQHSKRPRKRKRHWHQNACQTGDKILVIAWTLMKNKEPFSPSYLKTYLKRIDFGERAQHGRRGIETSGGTIKGLSLSPKL